MDRARDTDGSKLAPHQIQPLRDETWADGLRLEANLPMRGKHCPPLNPEDSNGLDDTTNVTRLWGRTVCEQIDKSISLLSLAVGFQLSLYNAQFVSFFSGRSLSWPIVCNQGSDYPNIILILFVLSCIICWVVRWRKWKWNEYELGLEEGKLKWYNQNLNECYLWDVSRQKFPDKFAPWVFAPLPPVLAQKPITHHITQPGRYSIPCLGGWKHWLTIKRRGSRLWKVSWTGFMWGIVRCCAGLEPATLLRGLLGHWILTLV